MCVVRVNNEKGFGQKSYYYYYYYFILVNQNVLALCCLESIFKFREVRYCSSFFAIFTSRQIIKYNENRPLRLEKIWFIRVTFQLFAKTKPTLFTFELRHVLMEV